MTIKKDREEIIKLLKEPQKKEKLIEKLKGCLEDENLINEYNGGIDYSTRTDKKRIYEDERFEEDYKIRSSQGFSYYISNYGRIGIGVTYNKKAIVEAEELKAIIPQIQKKWNWFLDTEKFKDEHFDDEFGKYKLTASTKVYDFMKCTSWLNTEWNELNGIYGKDCYSSECFFELHHICTNGDNRVDNLVYLPKCIHVEVHRN